MSSTKGSVYILMLLAFLVCIFIWTVMFLLYGYKVQSIEPELKKQQTISELQGRINTLKVKKSPPTQKEIESYVKTIFGKDAKVAIAVSHHECSPSNRSYPACVNKSDIEHSIGLFQINLYNKKHWIHAQKVPGKTMEEKIEWLSDPFNNTLVAYKIFKDWNGFEAWTAYTSNAYLISLKGGE